MTHTPGPWSTEDVLGDGHTEIILGYQIPRAGHPVMLATTFWDEGAFPIARAQANANALLMAAGPELLAACKTLLTLIERHGLRGDVREPGSHFLMRADIALQLDNARAAIAKATPQEKRP